MFQPNPSQLLKPTRARDIVIPYTPSPEPLPVFASSEPKLDYDGNTDRSLTGRGSLVKRPFPYNPSQLLNPKTSHSTQERHSRAFNAEIPSTPSPELLPAFASPPQNFVFSSAEPKLDHDGNTEPSPTGMGSLVERTFQVVDRDNRLVKRRKIDHPSGDAHTGKSGSNFAGGGKGGEIGTYMKQKREEKVTSPSSTIVDLTADDEDDIPITNDPETVLVCYGRLDSTKVQAHLVPFPNPRALLLRQTEWPAIKVELQRFPGRTLIIRVLDASGKDFGNVDVRTSQGLAPLMDSKSPRFRAQARLNTRKKKANECPGQPCSDYMDVTINLYGPKHFAQTVGRLFSQKQIFLRTPFSVDKGVEVCNPHALKIPALPRLLSGSLGSGNTGGTSYIMRTKEEERSEIFGVFDSLQKSENLPEMEPDACIVTPLLSHQKQGLYFMTNKEKARVFSDTEADNNSLWRLRRRPNGHTRYYNVITGVEEHMRPPEVLGGILADMMGLGKTLSMIALIIGSRQEARAWGEELPPRHEMGNELSVLRNSKTTLLICPLSVIANWEEQISQHVNSDTLLTYIYHGNNRSQDINALAQYDIIITTYSIISSEWNGRSKKRNGSPLLRTNFFRIVLDEAHMIREQSTRQFQAISTLSASRRWAVTGTPVQNRLEDLGALMKFLRIKPFDDKGGFSQYFLTPFKNADPEILPKLRLLVDTVTLRRLKDRIDLPRREDRVVKLNFSAEERELYEWFARDSANKMRAITGGANKILGGKTYVHVLQAILRLRLICAHGKELLGEEDLKLTHGLSSSNAIDLENDDCSPAPITSRQAYEMLMLFKETDTDSCAQCSRKLGSKDTNDEDNKDEVIGCMLPCYQIVCKDCSTEFKKGIEKKASQDNRFSCPFCDQYFRLVLFELTQEGLEAAEEAKMRARDNLKHAKTMGRYSGPHTKTVELLKHLRQSEDESHENPDQLPIKSVVFSGWTSHLDLIQIALEDNGIRCVRLDGRMTRLQRGASLEAFRDDPEVHVILVSISAGGLGLNLTSGSKVYVMEPQFNPAAEAQAIDRVHRLGQKREVTTTRFIMEDSFEEKMLSLQRKKQKLADLSMNRSKLDKAEAAKTRLEELRSLFR